MNAQKTIQETSTFRLSLAILNLDILSPLVFLHINVNPSTKKITGTCELSGQWMSPPRLFKTEITGEYRTINTMQDGDQLLVSLLGFPVYDQVCPTIKITLVINAQWKKGKVFYEYYDNDQWVNVNQVYLKIKPDFNLTHAKSVKAFDQPHPFPASSLDIQKGAYSLRPIA